MKTMTCQQLGGACNTTFQAETFEEMAHLSQQHGKAMFEQGDEPDVQAMNEMKKLMQDPAAVQAWMDGKRQEFDALPQETS